MRDKRENFSTPRKIVFDGGRVRAEGVTQAKSQRADSNQARLLRALLVRDHVHWMDGFLLFPTWRTKRQKKKPYPKQFGEYASKAAGLLRGCLCIDEAEWDSVTVRSTQQTAWSLHTTFTLTTNVAEVSARLDEVKEVFYQNADGATAWKLVHAAFETVNDDLTLIDPAKLLDALQFVGDPPGPRLAPKKLRDRIEHIVSTYNTDLVLAITKVVCLAHEELLGIKPRTTTYFLEDWLTQVGRARECLDLLKRARGGAPSSAGATVDDFVTATNDYRATCRDLQQAPAGSPERAMLDGEAAQRLVVVSTTKFAADVRREVEQYFQEQPHQGIREEDVAAHFRLAMGSFIEQHPCDFWPNITLLPLTCSFVRQYIWRERHGAGELLQLYATPGDDARFAAEISAMLDGVTNLAEATRSVHMILRQFRKSRLSLSPEKALTRLQAILRQDAHAAYLDRLHGKENDYLPQRLLAHFRPAFIEAGGYPYKYGLGWREQDPSELTVPAVNYMLIADGGGGKTTLLRRLQLDVLARDGWMAIHADAVPLARTRRGLLDSLAAQLHKLCDGTIPRSTCHSVLSDQADAGRLVLLVDQLDHLYDAGVSCYKFLRELSAHSAGIRLIVGARPSAVVPFRETRQFTLVRLTGFSDDDLKVFFGPSHTAAQQVCAGHNYLLQRPLWAYFIRRLLRSGHSEAIDSEWNLYDQLVRRTLGEHDAHLVRHDHHHWSVLVERLLGKIAFEAIASPVPHWTWIPRTFWARVTSDQTPIDVLATSGLAELVRLHPEDLDTTLEFSHQGMQEYFAASWLSTHDDDLRRVVNEYWSPKWDRVLQFLGGSKADHLIQLIYPSRECDNMLCSRLFAAVRCARHGDVSASTVRRLCADLRQVALIRVLSNDAIIALRRWNQEEARETLWSLVTSDERRMARHHFERVRFYEGIYTEDRACWACRHLQGDSGAECAAALVAWAMVLSERVLQQLISQLTGLRWKLAAVCAAASLSFDQGLTARDAVNGLDARESGHTPHDVTVVACIMYLASKNNELRLAVRKTLAPHASEIGNLAAVEAIPWNTLVNRAGALDDILETWGTNMEGAMFLTDIHMPGSKECLVLAFGHVTQENMRLVRTWLRGLPKEERMRRLERLLPFIGPCCRRDDIEEVLRFMMGAMKRRQQRFQAVRECAFIAGLLSDEEVWRILRLRDFGIIDVDQLPDLEGYALCLNREQRRYLVRRIEKASSELEMRALLRFLPSDAWNEDEVRSLAGVLRAQQVSGTNALYGRLQEIHAATGLVNV